MANVTIYLPADVAQKVRKVAANEGKSVSRWISGRVTELLDDGPATELLKLSGAFPDFPTWTTYDLLIAGTAISRRASLATSNTKEFSRIKDLSLVSLSPGRER
ncbi:MAG: hypothetical protein IT168_28650 [Bryobacterales bacterium]|nr:hypothetical protein [Bryobacterales bacterium]